MSTQPPLHPRRATIAESLTDRLVFLGMVLALGTRVPQQQAAQQATV